MIWSNLLSDGVRGALQAFLNLLFATLVLGGVLHWSTDLCMAVVGTANAGFILLQVAISAATPPKALDGALRDARSPN